MKDDHICRIVCSIKSSIISSLSLSPPSGELGEQGARGYFHSIYLSSPTRATAHMFGFYNRNLWHFNSFNETGWHSQEYCVSEYGQYHSICVDIDKFIFGTCNNLMEVGFGPIFFLHMFFIVLLCEYIRHFSDHESIVNVEFFSSTLSMHLEPGLL